MEDVDSNINLVKHSSKEWLIEQIDKIKQLKEENKTVTFGVVSLGNKGFMVKTEKVHAFIPFRCMPWRYTYHNYWNVVFPSLLGKKFTAHIYRVKEGHSNPLIFLKADTSQFSDVVFPFEKNETYTAIVLYRGYHELQIDLGYAFKWQYGSFVFTIYCSLDDKNNCFHSNYSPADEFNVVYTGKSIHGNDVFRYGENRYFSKEHSQIGRKLWTVLHYSKTNSGMPYAIIDKEYFGTFLLDRNDESDMSNEQMQKTLKTLHERQTLWCEIAGATSNGVLLLKWLMDVLPPVEDVLSVHNDYSVLNMNSPDLPEEKRVWINKKVWCEICADTYPRKFKFAYHYIGTISMDAEDYQDIRLSLIIKAIDELPKDQHIFCKIKGVYPDGTFKLKWIVCWDERAKKIVFPNKFSRQRTVIKERTVLEKKQALVGQQTWATVIKMPKVKDMYPAVFVNNDFLQNKLLPYLVSKAVISCEVVGINASENLQIKWLLPLSYNLADMAVPTKELINKEGWAEIKCFLPKNTTKSVFALFEGNYLAEITLDNSVNSTYAEHILMRLPTGQRLFCIVKNIDNDILQLKWLIEKDPSIDDLHIFKSDLDTLKLIANGINLRNEKKQKKLEIKLQKQIEHQKQLEIERQKQIEKQQQIEQKKIRLEEQHIGKKYLLRLHKDKAQNPFFLIENKYVGRIVVNKTNYPTDSLCHRIRENLSNMSEGSLLLCLVQKITPNLHFKLRWEYENFSSVITPTFSSL